MKTKGNTGKRAVKNGKLAEKIASEIFGCDVDPSAPVDMMGHPDIIEVKSIESDLRTDNSGYRRVKFRGKQREILKENEGLVFLYHKERHRGWLTHSEILSYNQRKYSWKSLAEHGTEIMLD